MLLSFHILLTGIELKALALQEVGNVLEKAWPKEKSSSENRPAVLIKRLLKWPSFPRAFPVAKTKLFSAKTIPRFQALECYFLRAQPTSKKPDKMAK